MSKDKKVQELEKELDTLKKKNLNKKELQIQRNRITAQLSRDRKRVELDYLKAEYIAVRQNFDSLN